MTPLPHPHQLNITTLNDIVFKTPEFTAFFCDISSISCPDPCDWLCFGGGLFLIDLSELLVFSVFMA